MRRKILNPFAKAFGDDYQCFGCSPHNSIGLQVDVWQEDDSVICQWTPKKRYEGYPNLLHGGIQATLLDEIASWVVYAIVGTAGVTSDMNIRYRKPVQVTEGGIKLVAKVLEQSHRIVSVDAKLYTAAGEVGSEATVRYFVFPENVAREKYSYPGKEAFFEESGL